MKAKFSWYLAMLASVAGMNLGLAQSPAAAPATVASSPTGSASPGIAFESSTFSFGRVKSGELVRHDFVFTNTGTAILEITDVRPGCGCTTAGIWDKTVQPGKTGIIPLQFNSTGFSGTVAKSATITCNDPARSNVVLQITGTIWKPIDITPAMVMFQLSDEMQTNETKVARIISNLDEPITVSDLQCTNQSFRADLKTVRAGKEFEVHVTALPPFASRTAYAPISLKTSSAAMPVINLSAYATVQPALAATPGQLWLSAAISSNATESTIAIRSYSTNAVALSDPQVNVPGAEVRLQEVQPGRLFNLRVTFPAGVRVEPSQKAEVTVKSNHPKYPLIRVPVIQQATPKPGLQPSTPLTRAPTVGPLLATPPGRPAPAAPQSK